MDLELFTLFKQYHNKSLKEFKKELLDNISSLFLNTTSFDKNNKTRICGYKRSRNRGYCKRLCNDKACVYHIKYILPDKLDSYSDMENIKNTTIINNSNSNNIINFMETLNNLDVPDDIDENTPRINTNETKLHNNILLNEKKNMPDKSDNVELHGNSEYYNKKKRKRYLKEYKEFCHNFSEISKKKNIRLNKKICNYIDFNKNKEHDNNGIKTILINLKEELLNIEELKTIYLYCTSFIICILDKNYNYENFIKIKKIIYDILNK